MVNEAPAGLKDVRSRLVLDTNASDERWERSSTEKKVAQVDKITLSATSEQRGRNRLRPAEGPWQFATALAVEGLFVLRAGTRSGREVKEAGDCAAESATTS